MCMDDVALEIQKRPTGETLATKMITVRVTPDEHKLIKNAAYLAGQSVNYWCAARLVALAHVKVTVVENKRA